MPAGRPSNYRAEYALQAEKLCLLLGATDAQLSDFFDVCEDTITEWKKVHPEFSVSVHAGKRVADAEVAHSLYNRAKGAHYISNQAIKVKRIEYDDKGKKTLEKEEIVIVPIETVEPPDTTACSFWLKNRKPAEWRDKTDVAFNGSLALDVQARELTDEQLLEIIAKKNQTVTE